MNGMVERVARAICRAGGDNPDMMVWPYHVPVWEMRANEARAAIAAMREPTEAMLKAGMEEAAVDLASEWRAMSDAALAD